LEETGFQLKESAAVLVNFLKSYFLIFACLTIPFWSQVRTQVITRAVTWMSIGFLVNIVIQMLMLFAGMDGIVYTPLLARLVPGEKSSLMIVLAHFSPFLGVRFPRMVLHTPDPPILGVVALLSFLICLGETDKRLRLLALIGSGCSLLISFSRLSWLCTLLIILTITLLRSSFSRFVGLWLTFLGSLLSTFLEISFLDLTSKFFTAFDSTRANSSAERAVVVGKTLEAWQEKPWLGWGFIRGRAWLYEDVYLGLGSFSSYAAVLYLNGIVGFIILIIAMILTLAIFYRPAISGDRLCQRALAGTIGLYVSLNATPLSWMAVYLWFFFLWLGSLMYQIQQQNEKKLSWS
jgi:O-antigen ligase